MTLQTGFDLDRAERTKLLETPRETLFIQENRMTFEIKPFEIVTFKTDGDMSHRNPAQCIYRALDTTSL